MVSIDKHPRLHHSISHKHPPLLQISKSSLTWLTLERIDLGCIQQQKSVQISCRTVGPMYAIFLFGKGFGQRISKITFPCKVIQYAKYAVLTKTMNTIELKSAHNGCINLIALDSVGYDNMCIAFFDGLCILGQICFVQTAKKHTLS